MSDHPIESIKYKNIKSALKIMAFVAIGLLMIWGRALYGSKKAYQEAETYLESNQTIRAITFYDRAIHWYTPLNLFVRKSAERLWEIGEDAAKRGEMKIALIAFRTIRRGFYASRSFYQPGTDWIKRCDSRIYDLMQVDRNEKGLSENSKLQKWYSPESQKDTSPQIFWTVILEIGFIGWIGSLIGFIIFMSKKNGVDKYFAISSIKYIGLTIAFFTIWIIGMAKA